MLFHQVENFNFLNLHDQQRENNCFPFPLLLQHHKKHPFYASKKEFSPFLLWGYFLRKDFLMSNSGVGSPTRGYNSPKATGRDCPGWGILRDVGRRSLI